MPPLGSAAPSSRKPTARRLLWCGVLVIALVVFIGCARWLFADRREAFVTRHASAGALSVAREPSIANGDIIFESLQLTAANGLAVRLRVVRSRAAPARQPLVLLLGGHRTGRDAVDLVGDPGDFAVVAMDYPYQGPDRIRGWRQGLRHVPEIRQALLDTPPALRIALDWLLQQSWVDARQVELIGVSFGAPFVAAAGALDARVTRVWIIQGAGDNRAWIEHNLRRQLPQPWLRIPAARLLHRLVHGASLDTSEWFAKIAPRPVIIVGAEDDERLPRTLVQQLYEAAREPKELVWMQGPHVNARKPETLRPMLELVWGRLRAERARDAALHESGDT